MTMVTFKRDDRGYMEWTRAHAEGFVLTRRRPDYSIHNSGCPAIFDVLGGVQLTSSEKVCGDNRHELERYAHGRTGLAPLRCEQCE